MFSNLKAALNSKKDFQHIEDYLFIMKTQRLKKDLSEIHVS